MKKYLLCDKCKNQDHWCEDVKINGELFCICPHILEEKNIKSVGSKLRKLNNKRKLKKPEPCY